MLVKTLVIKLMPLLVLSVFVSSHNALASDPKPTSQVSEFRELAWDDLMPEGWEPPELPSVHQPFLDFTQLDLEAPVVDALNDQNVKVPGFIIPLEYSETEVTEFLLVPFVGACIHVPPPPENQMVYVRLAKPLSTANLWDPVWVKGVMKTKKMQTEYAVAGYLIEGALTEKYIY